MRKLGQRIADRRLTLDVTPEAREWLALTGFDPVYGARPLRRLIQSAIGDKLARALLAGEIADGDTVRVDLDEAADALTVSAGSGRPPRRSPADRSGLVEQLIVFVLAQAEVVADPVPEAEQQRQLGGAAAGLPRLGAAVAWPRHSWTPAVAHSSAPARSPRSTRSSAIMSQILGPPDPRS